MRQTTTIRDEPKGEIVCVDCQKKITFYDCFSSSFEDPEEPTLLSNAQRWERIPGFCSIHGFPFYLDKTDNAAFCAICEWKYAETGEKD